MNLWALSPRIRGRAWLIAVSEQVQYVFSVCNLGRITGTFLAAGPGVNMGLVMVRGKPYAESQTKTVRAAADRQGMVRSSDRLPNNLSGSIAAQRGHVLALGHMDG